MAMKHPIDEPEPSKSNAMKKAASSLGLPVIDVKITKPMTNDFTVYVVVCSVRYEGENIHGIYDSLEVAQAVALERNASKYTLNDMTYSVIDWVINTTR